MLCAVVSLRQQDHDVISSHTLYNSSPHRSGIYIFLYHLILRSLIMHAHRIVSNNHLLETDRTSSQSSVRFTSIILILCIFRKLKINLLLRQIWLHFSWCFPLLPLLKVHAHSTMVFSKVSLKPHSFPLSPSDVLSSACSSEWRIIHCHI